MKIQCNVCEVAEATVLCCADEAALCWACDENVHAANKLAGKHQRVPLFFSSSSRPKCDICQEASGFFFCLQDRAVLCRKCDVAIHTMNPYVSAHQRFLLTGIRVGLESRNDDETVETKPFSLPITEPQKIGFDTKISDQISSKVTYTSSGSATGSVPQWQIDEIFGITDFDQSYEYMETNESSKADTCRRGDSDNSSMIRSGGEEDNNNCLAGRETTWAVPQINYPHTASGLNCPKHHSVFVPDISCSDSFPNGMVEKRRRQF